MSDEWCKWFLVCVYVLLQSPQLHERRDNNVDELEMF